MTITTLKSKEIPDLVSLYVRFINYLRYDCNETYFTYNDNMEAELHKYFEKKLNDPYHIVYLAKEKDKIMGFIAGDMRPSFFSYASLGLNGYISAIYVEEAYRKKDLSKKLETHIEEKFFRKHNAQYIELHCLSNNKRAKNLWQSLGYETFREQLRKKLIPKQTVI